jgi:hypothetical protein
VIDAAIGTSRPAAGRERSVIGDLGIALALLLLAVAAALLLVRPLITLPLVIPLDYNEGWNAFHAARAMAGAPLYPPPAAFVTNNYPPLSFYLVGALGTWLGDHVIAGRVIALASLVVATVNVGLIARALGTTAATAVFASLLFVGYHSAHTAGYIAMNDPQWLAHALMTTGMLVFVRGWRERRGMLAALALMLAAGLVKQALIPFPLAATLWLLLHARAAVCRWLVLAAMLLAGALVVLYLLHGPSVFHALLNDVRQYSLGRLADRVDRYLTPALVLLGSTVLLAALEFRRPQIKLIVLYVGFSLFIAVISFGGSGVEYNLLFDAIIGMTIATALAIDRVSQRIPATLMPGSMARAAAMFAILPIVLVPAPIRFAESQTFLRQLPALQAEVAADIALLAARPGPVACETLALCYWAGKSFEVDFFNLGQKFAKGVLPVEAIMPPIRDRYFEVVQYAREADDGLPAAGRLPREVRDALLEGYCIERVSVSGGVFLVPTRGPRQEVIAGGQGPLCLPG